MVTDRWCARKKAQVMYVKVANPVSFIRSLWQGAILKPDFVYMNSFLDPRFSIAPTVLARLGFFGRATIVLAPRGEFGAAALAIKARKKKAFLVVSRLIRLHSRIIWHASSDAEAEEIKVHRQDAQVEVRLNESTLPLTALRQGRPCGGTIRLAFVSRISEIKGVDLLLEAISTVRSDVSLDLYGSAIDSNYLQKCQEIAAQMPPNVQVAFRGSIDNSEVRDIFRNADAFFLPTKQENFGHAIAESLSAGCPVFVEDATPWTFVIKDGGGRIVPAHTVEAWSGALQGYCSLTPGDRTEMKAQAADAYERWRAGHEGPSVFDQILGRE
ncbi:glycosyltransferase family 4 protein [Dietzia maris]|uniref:glycosyltransferase family 4 protein n=1 Tax=Dietzia maris TaxID=37915 RepID=UPI0037CB1610